MLLDIAFQWTFSFCTHVITEHQSRQEKDWTIIDENTIMQVFFWKSHCWCWIIAKPKSEFLLCLWYYFFLNFVFNMEEEHTVLLLMVHTLFTHWSFISIFAFKAKTSLYVTAIVVTINWTRQGAVFAEMVRSRTT